MLRMARLHNVQHSFIVQMLQFGSTLLCARDAIGIFFMHDHSENGSVGSRAHYDVINTAMTWENMAS